MNKILRLREVITVVGLCRSTIYEKIDTGEFPKPVKLGKRAVSCKLDVFEDWIANVEHSQPIGLRSWR